jgi:hypothetical protein
MTPLLLAPGILLGLGTLYLFIHAAASSVGDGVGAGLDDRGRSSCVSADSITAVIGGGNNRVPAEERWVA